MKPWLRIWLVGAVCLGLNSARADEDEEAEPRITYSMYLRDKGLTVAECAEGPPNEVFRSIRERKHIYTGGTTGMEEDAITVFYERYTATLAPHVDAMAPAIVAKARGRLRQILHLIADFYCKLRLSRSYDEDERADACGEYMLLKLDQWGSPESDAVNASAEDTLRFIFTVSVLNCDQLYGRLNPNGGITRYQTKLRASLHALEKGMSVEMRKNLRYQLMDFAGRHTEFLYAN